MRTLVAALLSVCTLTTVQAATLNVPGDHATIQTAIIAAQSGDMIVVAAGTYEENIDFLGKHIIVTGSGGAEVTTIQAANTSEATVLFVNGEPKGAEISGFTITGGGRSGVYCSGSSPTITDNIITANSGSGDMVGGGVTLLNTTGSAVRDNIFRNNVADSYGASVLVDQESTDDTIAYNLMYNNVGYGEIRCCRPTDGLQILNNTIRPTTYTGITHQGTGTMYVRNNIIFDAPNLAVRDDNHTGTIEYNCAYDNASDYPYTPGPGNINANPMFVDVASNQFDLTLSSPCIDAGHPDPVFNDPDGTRNDMGALYLNREYPLATQFGIESETTTRVTNHTPVFFWSYYDSPVSTQAAYEVEVGRDLDWSVAEIWASGQVTSADHSAVFAGSELQDGVVYLYRIRVSNGSQWGGWVGGSFQMNTAPSSPQPAMPIGMASVNVNVVMLSVANADDPEDDGLSYDFEVYSDAGLVSVVTSVHHVAEQNYTTEVGPLTGLDEDVPYWWRSRSHDGYEYSDWSPAESFLTRGPDIIRVPGDYPTIQLAINASGDGDVVMVDPGNYPEHLVFGSHDITLASSGGAAVTFITAASYGVHIITFPSGLDNTSTIEGFTVRGADRASGVAINSGNSPTIRHCHLTDNSGLNGAGIFCDGDNVTVYGCLFTNNRCNEVKNEEGAGIWIGSDGVLVDSCVFTDNHAGDGSAGAIYARGATDVRVSRNLAYGNSSVGQGTGFMYAYSSSNITIINNTIVGNTTNQRAAGITLISDNTVDVRNNIIASNFGGHGLWVSSCADVVAEYNDVYDNETGDYYGVTPGIGSISADPLFTNAGIGDYSLLPYSPCLDAGDPDPAYNDPDGTRNDMGAAHVGVALPVAFEMTVQDEDDDRVVNHTPTFTWSYYDTPVSTQAAYEIEVGTDVDWSVAESWATGQVASGEQSIVYAGSALQDGVTYFYRIRVNNGSQWGDWIRGNFRMNAVPPPPVLTAPVDLATVNTNVVTLWVNNADDSDGDVVTYDFEVYSDAGLVVLTTSFTGVAEQVGQTSVGPLAGLDPDVQYWWRSRTHDGYEYSAWSAVESFMTRGPDITHVPGDYPTIQQALDASGDGDVIMVAPGDYPEHVVFGSSEVSLISSGGSDVTFISATTYGQHVLTFPAGMGYTGTVEGFTIRGAERASGIAVYRDNSPTIRFCHLTDNSGLDGAGIRCGGDDVTVHGCLFTNNRCNETKIEEGAGIWIGSDGVVVDSCVFTDNHAGNGSSGAIYTRGASNVRVSRNLAYDNSSVGQGTGFMYAYASSNITIVDNTIVGNTTNQRAAGITLIGDNAVDVRNNIIAFNFGGHGLWVYNCSEITAEYNDIYENEIGDYYGISAGVGSISLDPLFSNTLIDDYSLLPNSPCIDAGDPDPVYNDPNGTRSDMGAPQVPEDFPVVFEIAVENEDREHVVSHTPTIVWTYLDDPPSTQYAYELEIGTDQDWSAAEMWSTGQVVTANLSAVYDGSPLLDGVTYYLRLRAGNGTQWGSWRSATFHMNSVPSVPSPLSPIASTTINMVDAVLITENAIDPEGDGLLYDFEIYIDGDPVTPLASVGGVIEQPGQTSFGPFDGLETGAQYWWRVRASDDYETSDWSTLVTFHTEGQQTLRVPQDYATIQAAIVAAHSGDSVLVAAGTYTGSGNTEVSMLGKLLVVTSESGPEQTIIDCQGVGRAMYIYQGEDNRTVIEGFTMRSGVSSAGGGLRLQDASATVINCIFENNTAPHGGAVYINTPTDNPRFINCTFIDNDALGDRKDLSDGHGGAIYAQYGDLSAELTGCLFAGNEADYGGAVSIGSQFGALLTQCTMIDNFAANRGAAISQSSEYNVMVEQCLMAFNAGARTVATSEPTAYVLLSCTDIYGNEGGDWVYDIAGQAGINDNFSADPILCDYDNRDYSLRHYSPCAAAHSPCGVRIGALGPEACDFELPAMVNFGLGPIDPEHVVDHSPTFSWDYFDIPSSPQAGYEIEVGTDDDWEAAEMWASGQVATSDEFADYAGQPLTDGTDYVARLRVSNGVSWGSWDETEFHMNAVPSRPEPFSPVGQDVHFANVHLVTDNSTDLENDERTYDFEVYSDASLTTLVASFTAVAEQAIQTSVGPVADLEADRDYWWRVRAHDGLEYSEWSDVETFLALGYLVLRVPADYPSISAAISAAWEGDSVLVADGVYAGQYNTDLEVTGKAIAIVSENGPEYTVIDCQGAGRGFFIHSTPIGRSVIDGFTITAGNNSGGGGLRIQEATADVKNCVFYKNVAPHGGALYINTPFANPDVINCVFMDNDALGDRKDLADGLGGAIYTQYGNRDLYLTDCVFAGNEADYGGAIATGGDINLVIRRCTMADNYGGTVGSALAHASDDHAVVEQCNIAFNRGSYAVSCDPATVPEISCSNFFDNEGGDWVECIDGLAGVNGNLSVNPLFCGFFSGVGDFSLRSQSPCLPENNSCGVLIGARGVGSDCTDYLCGDADGNDQIDWDDVAFLRDCYLGIGPLPDPTGAGDPNCDGLIMISDLLYLVDYLRGTGPAPCCFYGGETESRIIPILPPIRPPKNDPPLDRPDASGGIIR